MANYYVDWQWTNPTAAPNDGSGTPNTYSEFDSQTSKKRIALPQKSSDSTSTSITLTGRGLPNYGEIQQENFLRLLENFASDTEPLHPTVGQIWYIPTRVGAAHKVNDLRICTAVTRDATTGLIKGGGTPDAPNETWARIYMEDNLPVTFFNQEDEPNGVNSDANGHSRYSNKAPKLGDVWYKPTGSLMRICISITGAPGDNSPAGIDARWKILAQWKAGAAFPVTPQKGEVFLRTDTQYGTLFYYDGYGRHGNDANRGWSEVLTDWKLAFFKGTETDMSYNNRTIAPGFIWLDTTHGEEVQNTVLKLCSANSDPKMLFAGAEWTKVARWKAGVGAFPSTASYGEIFLKDNTHLYVYTPNGWSEMYTTANRPQNFFYQDAEPVSVLDNSGIETARVDGNMWYHPTGDILHVFYGGGWHRVAQWKSVTTFPPYPQYGEICYKADEGLVYMFMNRSDGAYWVPIWYPTNTAAQDPIKGGGTVGGMIEFARADHRHRTPYVNELMDWTDGDTHAEGDVARFRNGKWLSEASATIFNEVKNYLISVGYAADPTALTVAPVAHSSSANYTYTPNNSSWAAITSQYKDPYARTVLLQPGWWTMTFFHGADLGDVNAQVSLKSTRYARVVGNGLHFAVVAEWGMYDKGNNINISYANSTSETVAFYIPSRGYYQVYISSPTYTVNYYRLPTVPKTYDANGNEIFYDAAMTGDQLAEMAGLSEYCPMAHLTWVGANEPVNEASIPTFNFAPTIDYAYNQFNVRAAAVAAGWNGTDRLIATITVAANGVIYSDNVNVVAFNTDGNFPAMSKITLINHGIITGAGGAGGAGARFHDTYTTNNDGWHNSWSGDMSDNVLAEFTNGGNGQQGGWALNASFTMTVLNYGVIAGGAGGGGGGGAIWVKPNWGDTDAFVWGTNNVKYQLNRRGVSGTGGGGGASYGPGGAGGAAIAWNTGFQEWGTDRPGSQAGLTSGGGTGYWGYTGQSNELLLESGHGGAGGGIGQPGSAGTYAHTYNNAGVLDGTTIVSAPGAGGAVGVCVNGNSLIIWSATGTRYGNIQ